MTAERIKALRKTVGGDLCALDYMAGRVLVYEFVQICDLALDAIEASSQAAALEGKPTSE